MSRPEERDSSDRPRKLQRLDPFKLAADVVLGRTSADRLKSAKAKAAYRKWKNAHKKGKKSRGKGKKGKGKGRKRAFSKVQTWNRPKLDGFNDLFVKKSDVWQFRLKAGDWNSATLTDRSAATSKEYGVSLATAGFELKSRADSDDSDWVYFYLFAKELVANQIIVGDERLAYMKLFERWKMSKIVAKFTFYQKPLRNNFPGRSEVWVTQAAPGTAINYTAIRGHGQYEHYFLANRDFATIKDTAILGEAAADTAAKAFERSHLDSGVQHHKTGMSVSMPFRPQCYMTVNAGSGAQVTKTPCGQAYFDSDKFFDGTVKFIGNCVVFKVRIPGSQQTIEPELSFDLRVSYYMHGGGQLGWDKFEPWNDPS